MSLKPGWIIFLMMFWVVIQVLITIGDTAQSLDGMNQAPIVEMITAAQKVDTLADIFSVDWGGVLGNLWSMFTFQANFLTGAWQLLRLVFICIYAGLGFSIIYAFFAK